MPYRFATTVTAPIKTALTADFAAATGWTPQSPINRAKWLDKKIDEYLRQVVRTYRQQVATSAAADAAAAQTTIDTAGLEEP